MSAQSPCGRITGLTDGDALTPCLRGLTQFAHYFALRDCLTLIRRFQAQRDLQGMSMTV